MNLQTQEEDFNLFGVLYDEEESNDTIVTTDSITFDSSEELLDEMVS